MLRWRPGGTKKGGGGGGGGPLCSGQRGRMKATIICRLFNFDWSEVKTCGQKAKKLGDELSNSTRRRPK